MLRNMVTSLLMHEKIETTLAKAKELQRVADKVIVLARRGDLHARRQALAILTYQGVVRKLFSDVATRFRDRAGGYTRLFKVGHRSGDAAPMAIVALSEALAPKTSEKKPSDRATSKAKKTARPKTKEKEKKPREKKERKGRQAEDQGESSAKSRPSEKGKTKKATGRKKEPQGARSSSS